MTPLVQAVLVASSAGDMGVRAFWTSRQVVAQRDELRSWRESLASAARRDRARRVRGYLLNTRKEPS